MKHLSRSYPPRLYKMIYMIFFFFGGGVCERIQNWRKTDSQGTGGSRNNYTPLYLILMVEGERESCNSLINVYNSWINPINKPKLSGYMLQPEWIFQPVRLKSNRPNGSSDEHKHLDRIYLKPICSYSNRNIALQLFLKMHLNVCWIALKSSWKQYYLIYE